MHRIQLSQDIRPLSEFRAHVASFIEQVHKTNRPLVITNHGKSTAILLNVSDYEAMLDKMDLLEDIQKAEHQLSEGKGINHDVARESILGKFKK